MKNIEVYLRTHHDRFVRELCDYLRFPSVSADARHAKGLHHCAKWLVEHCQKIGLEAELCHTKEPALGQTQQVTATFAANVNWTLQIQDVNSNTVRHASGSGVNMEFDWDGTGDGDTNLPDGIYTYSISAQTNGQSFSMMSSSLSSAAAFAMTSEEPTELWALPPDSSEPPLPLAIYPPGTDTNGFTIFEATPPLLKIEFPPSDVFFISLAPH